MHVRWMTAWEIEICVGADGVVYRWCFYLNPRIVVSLKIQHVVCLNSLRESLSYITHNDLPLQTIPLVHDW